jgi:hypothetical protein
MKTLIKFLLPALIATLPACTTHLQQKEQFLREAGFRAVTPSTPAQVAKIHSLPQGHITRVKHGGRTLFILADAKANLLLVGNNARFEQYQQILYRKKVNPEHIDEKVDKMEGDDWGGWGGMVDPFIGPMMFY